jgi:hypothetical protein
MNNNAFTIYTTGIGDWRSDKLVHLWVRELRNFIISKIPSIFDINIMHFDPLLKITNSHDINENENNNLINFYNQTLKKNKNCRIIDEVFIMDYFPFQSLNPFHIVLDFAHIFHYTDQPGEVLCNANNKKYKLHSIYLGYLGNDFEYKEKRKSAQYFPFYVSDQGQVITYIDFLIINGYNFDTHEPQIFLHYYPMDILRQLGNSLREKNKIFDPDQLYSSNNKDNLVQALFDENSNEHILDDIVSDIAM